MLSTRKVESILAVLLSSQIHSRFRSKKHGKPLSKVSLLQENQLITFAGNMFAKEIGCPDFDMKCMRSKSMKQVVEATDRVPIIINR